MTDYSNASRTMLLNIHTPDWDDELLEIFEIERSILPRVMPTSRVMAFTDKGGFFGMEMYTICFIFKISFGFMSKRRLL